MDFEPTGQHPSCQCMCPCHYHYEGGGGDAEMVANCMGIDPSNTPPSAGKNPFGSKAPKTPPVAGACFSKSFLHMKNMVKTMKAHWESLSEAEAESTRVYKTCKNVNNPHTLPCPSCTSNMKWDSVDKSDQESGSKYEENISEPDKYSFETLLRNRSKELVGSQSPSCSISSVHGNIGDNNDSDNVKLSQSVGCDAERSNRYSFEQEMFMFADTVTKQSSDIEQVEPRSGNSGPGQTGFHSSNPFLMDIKLMQNSSKADILAEDGFQPTPADSEKPRSIQSEVKKIRKSFEDAATEVVANVNRKSFDLNNRQSREAVIVKPFERNEPTFQKPESIENLDRQENEWKVNTTMKSPHSSNNVFYPSATDFEVRTIRDSFEAEMVQYGDTVGGNFDFELDRYNSEIRKSVDEYSGQQIASEENQTDEWKFYEDKNDVKDFNKDGDGEPLGKLDSFEKHRRQSDKRGQVGGKSYIHNSSGGQAPQGRRNSYPHESKEGLLAVAVHNRFSVPYKSKMTEKYRTHDDARKATEKKIRKIPQKVVKPTQQPRTEEVPLEEKDSEYIAYISMPNSKCDTRDNICHILKPQSEIQLLQEKSSETIQEPEKGAASVLDIHGVNTKSSVALQMYGQGIRRAVLTDQEKTLDNLSKEYNNLFVAQSTVLVESVGRSVSVTNMTIKNSKAKDPLRRTSQRQGSTDDKDKRTMTEMSMYRKRQFHICHKCHKIVEKGEAAFHLLGGLNTPWHRNCFKCTMCKKELSEKDHGFFEDEPYCLDDYISVARIPKCFKCQEFIFEPTYTSAAGHSWHREHFNCYACKKSLVDLKYVFVQGKYPYCFPCHETSFPKFCKTCDVRISPQEPYVQSGDTFWHSNDSCLQCSTCKRSLVGRSLFFRKDGLVYCNRYCALREI